MFGLRKNKTIGEITYAIDHDTGLLGGSGKTFKTVVTEHGKVFEDVYVFFNTKKFNLKYYVAGVAETVVLELLNDNSFYIEYRLASTEGKVVIRSNFSDMRRADFEVVSQAGFRRVPGAKASRLTSVISFYGGNPELLASCVTAFRSYLRNKSGGKLEPVIKVKKVKEPKKPGRVPSAVPTRTQGDNLKTYQLERRESVKELRDVMCSAKESLGVSVGSRGVPTISTVAIQDYVVTGLMEMSTSRDRIRVAKKIIRRYHFETPMQAKAFYPAAVDAVKAATEAIREYMNSK